MASHQVNHRMERGEDMALRASILFGVVSFVSACGAPVAETVGYYVVPMLVEEVLEQYRELVKSK